MSTTRHLRRYRIARNALAVIAIPLLALRVAQVFHLIHITGPANYVAFIASVLTVVGAVALGWTVDARQLTERAKVAEWEAARLRRARRQEQEAEDAEWARWWAEAREEDTIPLGPMVVSLDAWRHTQQPKAG